MAIVRIMGTLGKRGLVDEKCESLDAPADRRGAQRRDTRGLVLELQWVDRTARVGRLLGRRGRISRSLVQVTDLSLGGARIEAPDRIALRVGQVVELAADEDCRTRASVRHVSESESGTVAGLEFTTVRAATITPFFQRLLSQIEELGLPRDDLPLREEPAVVNPPDDWSDSRLRDACPAGEGER